MMLSALAGRSNAFLTTAARSAVFGRSLPGTSVLNAQPHQSPALLLLDLSNGISFRSLSSATGGGSKHNKFSPRRRPAANYRPAKPRGDRYKKMKGNKGMTMEGGEKFHMFGDQIVKLGDDTSPATGSEFDMFDDDGLSKKYGPTIARSMRQTRREQDLRKGQQPTADEFLRDMDYLTSLPGSTEDLVGERRALSFETDSEEEKERYLQNIDRIIEEQRVIDLGLEPYDQDDNDDNKGGVDPEIDMNDPFTSINPNQLAHGEWGEMVIRVDRNIKLWRGGRIQSYRALVIGGNLNGCAGFGTGKAPGAREAVLAASRKCKRNIFFIERYQNNALTRDLVGRSNSCKVVLRATNRGLRGNPLACEILKYFGITNCSAKAVHGNRSQFNVVRATFKALMTHESMEEIALKRGRRIVSIDRGRRMQLY